MPKSRKLRPSSTPGKSKGENCQRSQLKNLYSKDSRLHRTNPKLWRAAVMEVQNVQKLKGNGHTMSEFLNN